MPSIDDRLDRVLGAAPEIALYDRWLDDKRRAATSGRDYLFLDEDARFEPRGADVLVPAPGLEVRDRAGTACLVSPAAGVQIDVAGVKRRDVERIVAAVDGERCLVEVGWRAGVDKEALARVLRASFGKAFFAPREVAMLEGALSLTEIVRFPASPYAVVRAYWENMVDVRRHADAHMAELGDTGVFVRLLRELHVLALLGAELDRFYKPASPATDEGALPGSLWHARPSVFESPRGAVFTGGPRVLAPLVGGARFFTMLAASVGDPGAASAERADASGWGRVLVARAERDAEPKPWFLPPRPLDGGVFDALLGDFGRGVQAARSGDRQGAARALGRFHWRYVRLHPFRCANQSVAMNLVNAGLSIALGGGIPHLALDHLALRLAVDAYEEAFARAVRAFLPVGGEGPSARLAAARASSRRALAFMDRISACASEAEAADVARADPEGARLSLLTP